MVTIVLCMYLLNGIILNEIKELKLQRHAELQILQPETKYLALISLLLYHIIINRKYPLLKKTLDQCT